MEWVNLNSLYNPIRKVKWLHVRPAGLYYLLITYLLPTYEDRFQRNFEFGLPAELDRDYMGNSEWRVQVLSLKIRYISDNHLNLVIYKRWINKYAWTHKIKKRYEPDKTLFFLDAIPSLLHRRNE